MFGRGAVKKFTAGLGNAVSVIGGQLAVRAVPAKIEESRIAGGAAPFTAWTRTAIQAGVAVAVGMVADSFLGVRRGEFVLAGALQVPVQSALVQLNIPFVSEQLAGVGVGRYLVTPGVGAYDNRPKALSSGMGRYLGRGVAAVPAPHRPGIPGVRSALAGCGDDEMMVYG